MGVAPKEAAAIARRMFGNIGRTLLEVLYIPALTPEKLRRWVTIENLHYMAEALSHGRGVVILTAHFGNWEWMAARLVRAGFPILDRYVHSYMPLVGYRGGMRLVELICNALLDRRDRDAKDEDFELVM